MTRLLGIDLGARRIGLAVADTETNTIRGLSTIRRSETERDVRTLAGVIGEQRIDELVIGLPRNFDGSEGPQALATRRWADEVVPLLERPINWRDERLTSERALLTVGRAGRGRSGGPPSAAARATHRAAIDRQAAVLILQAELDARAGLVSEA